MTFTTLPPLPPTPDDLIVAARSGRLVPFIGAGASRLAGCPSWEEFANAALAQCRHVGPIVDTIIAGKLSPRTKLGLALQFAQQSGKPINYDQILHQSGWEAHADGRRMYQALTGLSRHFVTTNYDRWLDTFMPPASSVADSASSSAVLSPSERKVIYLPDSIAFSHLNSDDLPTVTHLHGSVRDATSMVMSTRQYMDRYALRGERWAELAFTPTQEFLQLLFRLKTVVFIGYGLEELEILEYVLMKAKGPAGKHFILQGFAPGELELANHMAAYFKHECGVTLIPFEKTDHVDLINVVEAFARDMTPGPMLQQERRLTMDRLLND